MAVSKAKKPKASAKGNPAAKSAPRKNTAAKRSNTGRPSSYKQEFAAQAEKLCQLGATDIDLAGFFGVTTVTIWRWQSEHEEFCNALRVGKIPADDRVKRSLYQRAIGYSFSSEKIFSNNGVIVKTPCVEHVPPDANACKVWLFNRLPKEWRDNKFTTHDVTGDLAKFLSAVDGVGWDEQGGGE